MLSTPINRDSETRQNKALLSKWGKLSQVSQSVPPYQGSGTSRQSPLGTRGGPSHRRGQQKGEGAAAVTRRAASRGTGLGQRMKRRDARNRRFHFRLPLSRPFPAARRLSLKSRGAPRPPPRACALRAKGPARSLRRRGGGYLPGAALVAGEGCRCRNRQVRGGKAALGYARRCSGCASGDQAAG